MKKLLYSECIFLMTGWIGSVPVQISGCCLDGALSWWCNELLLVVVVLCLSVVPHGRAIGLLATKGNPPPDCSGQGEGPSFLASCRASRAVADAPSFQTCLRACTFTFCMRVCIYVYVYLCADMYPCIYVHVCMYMYMCAFIHMCMCMCMHICA